MFRLHELIFSRGKTAKGSPFLFKGDSLVNALGTFLGYYLERPLFLVLKFLNYSIALLKRQAYNLCMEQLNMQLQQMITSLLVLCLICT